MPIASLLSKPGVGLPFFRHGHSQAVRIPAELAYDRSVLELEIERVGDELRIRPAGRPIASAIERRCNS